MSPSRPEGEAGFRAFASPGLAAAGLVLTPAREADFSLLATIYATAREEELRLAPWTDAQKRAFTDWQSQQQELHYALHYPAAERLVIARDEPIGRMYVDTGREEVRLMDLTLLPACRSRGVGTILVQALLAYSDALRRPASLHVEPGNPARRLYLRLGFEAVETRGMYEFMKRPAPGAVS